MIQNLHDMAEPSPSFVQPCTKSPLPCDPTGKMHTTCFFCATAYYSLKSSVVQNAEITFTKARVLTSILCICPVLPLTIMIISTFCLCTAAKWWPFFNIQASHSALMLDYITTSTQHLNRFYISVFLLLCYQGLLGVLSTFNFHNAFSISLLSS